MPLDKSQKCVVGWLQITQPETPVTTLEEAQRFLNTLRTFYIITLRNVDPNPYSFAQFDMRGEIFIGIWSSKGKARGFIHSQKELSANNSRVVGMDAKTLLAFAREAGIAKMILDYETRGSKEKVLWFYMRDVSTQ